MPSQREMNFLSNTEITVWLGITKAAGNVILLRTGSWFMKSRTVIWFCIWPGQVHTVTFFDEQRIYFNCMVAQYNDTYCIKSRILLPMSADTLTAPIWHVVAWTRRRSDTLWITAASASRWTHTPHLGLDDAGDEIVSLEELKMARKEVEKTSGEFEPATQNMFKVVWLPPDDF